MKFLILKLLLLIFITIGFYLLDSYYSFSFWIYAYLFFLESFFLIFRFRNYTIVIVLLLFSSLWGLEFIITDILGWGLSSGIIVSQLKFFYILLILAYLPLFFINISSLKLTENKFQVSKYFFYLVFFLSLYITVFKINGVVVLGGSNGGYSGYVDNLEAGSGLIEYVLIFFCYLFLYKNLNFFERILRLLLILIFIVKCNLYGFRIQGIMAVLLLFYVIFSNKISALKTIIVFFPTVILAMLLGLAKHTDNLDLALLLNNDAIESTHMGTIISGTIALKSYPINYGYSLLSLITWIFPPSLLTSSIPELYPSVYSQKFLGAAGGMPFPITGYLFGNYFGVLIIGIIAAFFVYLIINSSKNNLFKFLSMVLITFFPRWILYDFVNFGIRTFIYSLLLFVFFASIDRAIKYKKMFFIK